MRDGSDEDLRREENWRFTANIQLQTAAATAVMSLLLVGPVKGAGGKLWRSTVNSVQDGGPFSSMTVHHLAKLLSRALMGSCPHHSLSPELFIWPISMVLMNVVYRRVRTQPIGTS